MNTLRTLWQINLFAVRVLQARSWWGLGVSVLLFAIAAWLGLQDFSQGAWLSFAAGSMGLGRELWVLFVAMRAPGTVELVEETEFKPQLVAHVRPSEEELRDGFEVVPLPHRFTEAVVRSSRVDAWLREHEVAMREDRCKREDVDRLLRDHAPMLETVLRCHGRKSLRADPPRVLFNEDKLGLSDGISPSRPEVRVHEVGYFHSLLTNEAATRCLEPRSADPEPVFSGSRLLFPVDRHDGLWTLRSVAHSRMSDHIGVSTLVVTRDRKLVFWNQGNAAQQSRNSHVSTGSGSCDWSDRVGSDLKATMVAAMEREFLEESFGGEAPPAFARRTRVLGYFRWLSRAGKPEFTGVTHIDLDAPHLRPNIAEVNRRQRERLCRDVPTLPDLIGVLGEVLESDKSSVSLWANALALREAIAESPAEWGAFLGLPDS